MVPGWIAVALAVALVAGQTVVDEQCRRQSDEQSTLSALDHAPLPARVQRGQDVPDSRRAISRSVAVIAGELDDLSAREVTLAAPLASAVSPGGARRGHTSRSRAPPAA